MDSRASAVDFAKWHATDFEWPTDGERGAATAQNQKALKALGVAVSHESVDAMNVGAFLCLNGINADDVVLAVLNGMCSRVGADNNEYRQTQRELQVPPGDGPLSCAFAALTAALPQATVVVSATGKDKEKHIRNVKVRRAMTRPVLCREVHYPDPIEVEGVSVRYKPESNDHRYRFLPDPFPLGLVAIGPAIGAEAQCFGTGEGSSTMCMGPLVLEAVASGGTLLFLGEFTCTSVLHLAYYAEHMMRAEAVPLRPPSWTKLQREMMQWGEAEYSYEETVAYCTLKLQWERKDVRHVGMHAARLWLYKACEDHITNFWPGADWYPAGGSPAVRDRSRSHVRSLGLGL